MINSKKLIFIFFVLQIIINMFLVLFQRVMNLEDKIVLYIVPKIINSNNHNFRSHFKKEQNSLARDVYMLQPILIGDYDLSRYKLHKICKEDTVLEIYKNSELFLHYYNVFNDLNITKLNDFSNDIKNRLKFVLKKYENSLQLNFDQIVNENFIQYKSFYKLKCVKRVKRVKFDLKISNTC